MADHAYDTDLALWARQQARALRDAGQAGTNLPIDWENVAEEIESLGKSQARELRNRIRTILVHLMKLEASPSDEPRPGWRETIQEQRNEVEAVLVDSPSLRPMVPTVIDSEVSKARDVAALALQRYREQPKADLDALHYAADQVLGDWFPDRSG